MAPSWFTSRSKNDPGTNDNVSRVVVWNFPPTSNFTLDDGTLTVSGVLARFTEGVASIVGRFDIVAAHPHARRTDAATPAKRSFKT